MNKTFLEIPKRAKKGSLLPSSSMATMNLGVCFQAPFCYHFTFQEYLERSWLSFQNYELWLQDFPWTLRRSHFP